MSPQEIDTVPSTPPEERPFTLLPRSDPPDGLNTWECRGCGAKGRGALPYSMHMDCHERSPGPPPVAQIPPGALPPDTITSGGFHRRGPPPPISDGQLAEELGKLDDENRAPVGNWLAMAKRARQLLLGTALLLLTLPAVALAQEVAPAPSWWQALLAWLLANLGTVVGWTVATALGLYWRYSRASAATKRKRWEDLKRAARIGYQVVNEISKMTPNKIDDKVAEGLKYAAEALENAQLPPLEEGEHAAVALEFRALHGEEKVAEAQGLGGLSIQAKRWAAKLTTEEIDNAMLVAFERKLGLAQAAAG